MDWKSIEQVIMESIRQTSLPVDGLRTHFEGFDNLTGGLKRSNLIVIAGLPSMGKTAFVMNIAENVAMIDKKVVGLFSLQMSKESLQQRLLSSQSRVGLYKLRMGFIRRDEVGKVANGLGRLLDNPPLFIDDTYEISVSEMRAKCRELCQKRGRLDLLIVDCVQLISTEAPGDTPFYENRRQELARLSRELKALSKELDCPLIAVCSLKRASQGWPRPRPTLADLDEYGSIEAEADVVAFIHRQEVYNPEDPELQGLAELIVAKQRDGPTGIVPLCFLKQLMRFENRARDAGPSDSY